MLMTFSVLALAAPLDTDGDGVEDELDNCPTEANPSRRTPI